MLAKVRQGLIQAYWVKIGLNVSKSGYMEYCAVYVLFQNIIT